MTNFDLLAGSTRAERAWLQDAPVIRRSLTGEVTRELYVAFLTQAYHHVRHTIPLLMAVGSRLSERHCWLQQELVHYLEEELGHEAWILNDIAAAGGDAGRARLAQPAVETDTMVAYAYDMVMRRQPVGFFGMVFVLEGTSVSLALHAAASIQAALKLPDRAFTYLRSHGKLDQQHVGHLRSIVDRLDPEQDMPAVLTCARAMYWLYGNVFRGLERSIVVAPDPEQQRAVA
jgi:pyrroloquinoline quinone (PQQ) biosynthesis protein C